MIIEAEDIALFPRRLMMGRMLRQSARRWLSSHFRRRRYITLRAMKKTRRFSHDGQAHGELVDDDGLRASVGANILLFTRQ